MNQMLMRAMEEVSHIRFQAHRLVVSPHSISIQTHWLNGRVFILGEFNKCVGGVVLFFKGGIVVMVTVSSSILFKYE